MTGNGQRTARMLGWLLAILAIGAVGPLLPAWSAEPLPAAYADQVDWLLGSGLDRGGSWEKAQIERQRTLPADLADPRLEFAWALVCLRWAKYDQAEESLIKATRAEAKPYWPAWRNLVRLEAAREDYPDALRQAGWLARALAGVADDSDSEEVANWLGRMLAFLELAAQRSDDFAAEVARYDGKIRDILDGRRLAEYEQGRLSLSEPKAAAPPGPVGATGGAAAGATGAEPPPPDRQREQLQRERDRLYGQASRTRKEIRQQLETLDNELAELQQGWDDHTALRKDFARLKVVLLTGVAPTPPLFGVARNPNIAPELAALTDDIREHSGDDQLCEQLKQLHGRFTNPRGELQLAPAERYPALAARLAAEADKQDWRAQTEMNRITKRAQYLLPIRARFAAQLELTEAAGMHQDKLLQEWEKRIVDQNRQQAKAAAAEEAARQQPDDRSVRPLSLRELLHREFPMEYDLERSRLLDSLRP